MLACAKAENGAHREPNRVARAQDPDHPRPDHRVYFEAGPTDGPLLVFVHGFPATGLTWRHQLEHFAALGFHTVAPTCEATAARACPMDPTLTRTTYWH